MVMRVCRSRFTPETRTHDVTGVDTDPAEEKARLKREEEEYKPLLEWLKKEAQDIVRDGQSVISRFLSAH